MPVSRTKAREAVSPDISAVPAELPPADTERWVARRKAQVVAAVQAGLLSLDEALARYKLSIEEFTGWQRALYRHGLRGLQITHIQMGKLADRRRRRAGSKSARKPIRWSSRHV